MNLREALEALGNTSREVATTLENKEILGDHSFCGCPVAVYLKECGFTDPSVHVKGITAGMSHELPPTPVAQFITDFDDGNYPTLDRSTWK